MSGLLFWLDHVQLKDYKSVVTVLSVILNIFYYQETLHPMHFPLHRSNLKTKSSTLHLRHLQQDSTSAHDPEGHIFSFVGKCTYFSQNQVGLYLSVPSCVKSCNKSIYDSTDNNVF